MTGGVKVRLARGGAQRLGRHQADHQAADQSGTGGRGNGIEVRQFGTRLAQGAGNQPVKPFNMGAGGNFGNHAAKFGVFLELAENHI